MLPLKVNQDRFDILRSMFNNLVTKYTFESIFRDGIVTLRTKENNDIRFVHWYELIFEVVLTTIAKHKAGTEWKTKWPEEYVRLTQELVNQRHTLEFGKHPIDFAYEEYLKLIQADKLKGLKVFTLTD